MSCGYEGHHFGTRYPDATCIDGYLWDLDSFEDGFLTSGGDLPCPKCNLTSWLDDIVEYCQNDLTDVKSFDQQSVHFFNKAIIWALKLHTPNTLVEHLDNLSPQIPFWKRDEDTEDENTVNLAWPWNITDPNLTSHTSLALRSVAKPPHNAEKYDTFWLVPAS